MPFPGSLSSWFSNQHLLTEGLQTHTHTHTKTAPNKSQLTLELLQIQKQQILKVGLSAVTFDSFEQETKGHAGSQAGQSH